MPYIDHTPVEKVKQAIDLWKGVMHDPNIDGFNGYNCKQKIQEVLEYAKKALEDAPMYAPEREDWK